MGEASRFFSRARFAAFFMSMLMVLFYSFFCFC